MLTQLDLHSYLMDLKATKVKVGFIKVKLACCMKIKLGFVVQGQTALKYQWDFAITSYRRLVVKMLHIDLVLRILSRLGDTQIFH